MEGFLIETDAICNLVQNGSTVSNGEKIMFSFKNVIHLYKDMQEA